MISDAAVAADLQKGEPISEQHSPKCFGKTEAEWLKVYRNKSQRRRTRGSDGQSMQGERREMGAAEALERSADIVNHKTALM
jgi:hypothetical protein